MCYNVKDILGCCYLVYIPPHFPEDFQLANPEIRSHCAIPTDRMLREKTRDNRSGFQILVNEYPYDHCRDVPHS